MRKLLGKYGLLLLVCLLLLWSVVKLAGDFRLQGNGAQLGSSCVIFALLIAEMQRKELLRQSTPVVCVQWISVAAALAFMFLAPANG